MRSEPPGSSWVSSLEGVAFAMPGAAGVAAGLVSMALFLRFPGEGPRLGPSPGSVSPGGGPSPRLSATPHAVLLNSLASTPSREQYARAAGEVPGVTAADQRGPKERLGILIRKVDADTARRFCEALSRQGVPARAMAESDLYPLPMGRRVRALRLQDDRLWETDLAGREHAYRLEDLLWCGGGRIHDLVLKTHSQIKTRTVRTMGRYARKQVYEEKTEKAETSDSLRLEWWIRAEPRRLIWTCDREARLPLNRVPVGPADPEPFDAFLRELAQRIPTEKTNIGIRRAAAGKPWTYPSVSAFEEEGVWAQSTPTPL